MQPATTHYLDYLNRIDLLSARQKIDYFRNEHTSLDDAALRQALWDIFLVEGHASLPIDICKFGYDGFYWRVRTTRTEDVRETIRQPSDLWMPPAEHAPAGRLNAANAPLLYAARDDPMTAVLESRPEFGSNLALIKYRPVEPVNLVSFSAGVDPVSLPESQRQKHELLSNFVSAELFHPSDDPERYRITNLITTDMFDLPPQESSGWIYPSVRHKTGVNVAIRAKQARKTLRPIELHACTWTGTLTIYSVSTLRSITPNGFVWQEPEVQILEM